MIKNLSKDTIINILFGLFAVILSAVITSMMEFKTDFLSDPKYWIDTGIRFVVMMTMFQLTKRRTIITEKKQENTLYHNIVKIEYGDNLEYIQSNHLESLVEESVNIENEKRKKDFGETYFSKHFTRSLLFSDIDNLTDDDLYNYFEENKIKKIRIFKRWKLRRVFNRCKMRKYKYEKFTYNDIMIDSDIKSSFAKNPMVISKSYSAIESINRSITFLLCGSIVQSLMFNGFNINFLIDTATYLFLLFTTTISGMNAANNFLNLRIQVIRNRNDFFSRYLKKKMN